MKNKIEEWVKKIAAEIFRDANLTQVATFQRPDRLAQRRGQYPKRRRKRDSNTCRTSRDSVAEASEVAASPAASRAFSRSAVAERAASSSSATRFCSCDTVVDTLSFSASAAARFATMIWKEAESRIGSSGASSASPLPDMTYSLHQPTET